MKVFLLPGNNFVSRDPVEIVTVLGSCVSVVLFDEGRKVVGMSHYLLPSGPEARIRSHRYASHALPSLVEAMLHAGSDRHRLSAWVFGGANALGGSDIGRNVGELNIEAAYGFLRGAGIPVREAKVGGVGARKIRVGSEPFLIEHVLGGERSILTPESPRRTRAR